MNETATETTTPNADLAADAPPQDDANSGSPASDPSTGLLESAGNENKSTVPDTETTPTPESMAPDVESETRPENWPQNHWSDTKSLEENADSLAKGYNDSRNQNNKLLQQLAEKGESPENAEGYLKDYVPPHRSRPTGNEKEGATLDRYGELDAGDPVFIAMSKAAKNANLSQGQFTDLMQVAMEELHPILPEPFNAEKEKEILGENAEGMIKTNKSWIDNLARNGVVNEDEFDLLLGFGATALGVQLVNKLRLNSGEKPVPVNLNGNANKGRKTPDECQAMMADERYYQDGPVGDAFRAEVDKAFIETFGTGKS